MEKTVITADGIRLWSESFGATNGTPVVLIMGAMNPGLVWPDAFCLSLARNGFQVIRYDHRDTGQSSTIDFAAQPYTLDDLAEDALAVLDGYGFARANLVGLSMGGYIAQILAARQPHRVERLVLLSTTADHRPYMAATTGGRLAEDVFLPPPAASFVASVKAANRSPGCGDDAEQMALAVWQASHGGSHPFPRDFVLAAMRKIRAHARDPAVAFHHAPAVLASPPRMALLSDIRAPTLVMHGRFDPCLPLDHGRYLAETIRSARLHVLDMGHLFPPDMAEEIAHEISVFFQERLTGASADISYV